MAFVPSSFSPHVPSASPFCHRFRERLYHVVTRTMKMPLVTYEDRSFSPMSLGGAFLSVHLLSFLCIISILYPVTVPVLTQRQTHALDAQCVSVARSSCQGTGVFLSKGLSTVRRGPTKLRQCCKDAVRRARKVTTGESPGLPSSTLRKEQQYGMDLRSSQQSCEVGDYAFTVPTFPLRTLKILHTLGRCRPECNE